MNREIKSLALVVIVYVLFSMLMMSKPAKGAELDCNQHRLYCKILKFNPKIDPAWAMTLSNKIYTKAKNNGVDPNISLAILMQESSLENKNTFRVDQHIEKKCDQKSCTKIVTETHHVVDMTIAQININTAVQFGFDIQRLFSLDLDYALDCHYIVLKSKLNMCKDQENAWACYHSITKEHKEKYINLVSRYL